MKSYNLKHSINKQNEALLHKTLVQYRITARSIGKLQWQQFYCDGSFSKYAHKCTQSKLSQRYIQTCHAQVTGMLKSFISNRQNDFVDAIRNVRLDVEIKKQLLYINKAQLWFSRQPIDTKKLGIIQLDTIKLARKIFRGLMNLHRQPNYSHINMQLDAKVVDIQQDNNTTFTYWLMVSSIQKGKKIKIPLKTNDYFANAKGAIKNFVQLNFKDNQLQVYLIRDDKTKYKKGLKIIGLDFGLTNLIATSEGDLLGRNFYTRLANYDDKIAKIKKANGNNQKSKQYKKIINKAKNFIKNECNRVINRVLIIHNPKEIIVEKLNFQNSNLSRKMNRLLHNCGLGTIRNKLESLKIEKINPAYTSKTCSSCGYVHPRNRISQGKFVCRFCGARKNADVNGACNIRDRRSNRDINCYIHTSKVLDIVVKNFIEQRLTGSRSTAVNLDKIKSNPYFSRVDLTSFYDFL